MKHEKIVVDGQEVSFSSDWINDLEQEIHFNWYYHQAELVYSSCSSQDRIMEIGIGTGLLSDLLKKRGWNIQTLDIDERKNPDFCESAFDFDYTSQDVNTVLAFEIFEHMPFETFLKTVGKMSTAGIEKIHFSLPWNEVALLDLSLKLPKIPRIEYSFTIAKRRITTETHFWELSNKDKQISGGRLTSIPTLEGHFGGHGFSVQTLKKVGYIQYFSAVKI